jgi:folate-binding protein YgfZ
VDEGERIVDEAAVADGVSTARTDVAAFEYHRDVLRVSGADAVSYLQGQVSADVAALAVGQSAWSLVLEPQGKVDAWFRIARTGDTELLVDVDGGWGERTAARLRRFLLRVDVAIEPVERRCLALRGPLAAAVAADVTGADLVLDAEWRGLPGVDVFGPERAPSPVAPPAVPAPDPRALHVLRVEQGWPAMGHELDATTIPAEAGQWLIDSSVSFTKGCYTGQELVARVDSRGGNVPHHLLGVVLRPSDGEVAIPEPGAPVLTDGVERATVTSSAWSPTLGAPIALCMLHRTVEVGADVEVGGVPAAVVELPFVQPRGSAQGIG